MEKQFHIEFPELMKGKKVMYVHGFASSAQSGTVALLRQLMPNAEVVADEAKPCTYITFFPFINAGNSI